jgi:general secretion pathway protein L
LSNYLFIKAPRSQSLEEVTKLEWLKRDDLKDGLKSSVYNESTLTGSASIKGIKKILNSNLDCIKVLIVPGEDVRSLTVDLPNKSKAARRTIPFQLEEHLSSKIEYVHIASNEIKENRIETLAVEHQKMVFWQTLANSMNVQFDYVLADYTLMPTKDQPGSIWSDGEKILIKSTEFQGALTPLLFDRIRSELWPELWSKTSENTEQLKPYASSESSFTYPEHVASTQIALLPLLAKTFTTHKNTEFINLLQGQYAIAKSSLNRTESIKKPAFIAGFLVIICLILAMFGNYQLEEKHTQIKQQMVALYQQLYPKDRRINNPYSQMQGKLKQGISQKSPYFLQWLTAISPLLKQQSIKVINLKYDLKPLAMRLQLEANDYSTLEKLVGQLNANEQGLFIASLGSLQKSSINQKVTSIITVREK